MKELTKELMRKWGSGTVILSPRDLTAAQIRNFAREFLDVQGNTLLDPQLYYPRANHQRLTSHDYWPDDYSTGLLTGGSSLTNLLTKIRDLNNSAMTSEYILPGLFCSRVDEDWFYVQELITNKSVTVMSDKRRLATLCLSHEILRYEEQIEDIVSRSESWNVDGYYIIAEHPNGQYLVDDPMWLANLLLLCSGLKLQGRKVIVGYGNHQMLCLASANVDAIATGNWLNVRNFSSERFNNPEENTISRRAKWYYCPQSLSEYKIPFLDIAFRSKILDQMAPDKFLNSDYTEVLFAGAQPSLTSYGEKASFRHYMHCLHEQCKFARRNSFNETVSAHELLLETAHRFIKSFHRFGVRGQNRDFSDMLDVNRAALSVLQDARGFILDRQWSV